MRDYITSDVVPYLAREWKEGVCFTSSYLRELPENENEVKNENEAQLASNTWSSPDMDRPPSRPHFKGQTHFWKRKFEWLFVSLHLESFFFFERNEKKKIIIRNDSTRTNQKQQETNPHALSRRVERWNPQQSVAGWCAWVSHYCTFLCYYFETPKPETFDVCSCSLLQIQSQWWQRENNPLI